MPSMTDPMDALLSFQQAYDDGHVEMEQGRVHRDVFLHVDQPAGVPRMTFVQFDGDLVTGLVEFVVADPIDGVVCWQTGYAVRDGYRGRGLGSELLKKGIDEMQNGFRGMAPSFFVEAIISEANVASRRVAERVLGGEAESCTDSHSGVPAVQFKRLVTL